MNDTLRVGATALVVATGLLALATTAQTPDGYFHASLGGPLDVFSTGSSDVLAIGDGSNDISELTSLLKGPVGPAAKDGAPNSPFRIAYEAGAAPNATTGAAAASTAPDSTLGLPPMEISTAPSVVKDSAAILPSKPVVDSQGRIDCSGSVSCHTDPTTNVTTVTYPDGVVAIIQKINDLTVVAYKSITDVLPSEISSWLPPVPNSTTPLLAAGAPTELPKPATIPSVIPSVTTAPTSTPTLVAEPEPSASEPDPVISDPDIETDRGPRINVSTPSKDFTPGRTSSSPKDLTSKVPGLDKVADAIGGVVDSVSGTVGKVLGPGASHKPENADQARNSKPQTSNDDGADSP